MFFPLLAKFFEECDINTPKFDSCLTKSFNDLRPLFKTGKSKSEYLSNVIIYNHY